MSFYELAVPEGSRQLSPNANILRFVETLKEMVGETQFLIVTHNKLTMEVASTLYGVTMEERGVSKVVSVHLNEAA